MSWLNAGHAIAAGAEGLMLSRWLRENPIMPNIYAANRYAPLALSALNKLRVDPYNQLQAINNADRTAYYRIQQNGGYTGGQRQNSRIALALGNARNIADVLNNTQLQNNKYRQNWAEAALSEGNQDAARRQQASQYAWNAYNRAYSAKVKGIETHLSSLSAIAQKYFANRIKNKQYEDTLGLYQQDIDNRKDAIKALYNNSSTQTNTDTKSTTNTPNLDMSVMDLKYGDNTINKLQAPYGKYWYIDPDKVAESAKSTRNWAKSKEQYQRGAFGTPYERINFSSDYTGGFGPNGLFAPVWAGGLFDYNPYNITSLRLTR